MAISMKFDFILETEKNHDLVKLIKLGFPYLYEDRLLHVQSLNLVCYCHHWFVISWKRSLCVVIKVEFSVHNSTVI